MQIICNAIPKAVLECDCVVVLANEALFSVVHDVNQFRIFYIVALI